MIKPFNTFILILLSFNCFSQIIDKSKDIKDIPYKFRLPLNEFSLSDFTLISQYIMTNRFVFGNSKWARQENLIDFMRVGDILYYEVKKRQPNLSRYQFTIRRYSGYEIEIYPCSGCYEREYSLPNKLDTELSLFILNYFKNGFDTSNIEDNDLNFIPKEDYLIVPGKSFMDNSGLRYPIKYAFTWPKKMNEKYSKQLQKVLFETDSHLVEIFPIIVLMEDEEIVSLYIDVYFSHNNSEQRNETFEIRLNKDYVSIENLPEKKFIDELFKAIISQIKNRIFSNEAFIKS
jgi:hypothetical protein